MDKNARKVQRLLKSNRTLFLRILANTQDLIKEIGEIYFPRSRKSRVSKVKRSE